MDEDIFSTFEYLKEAVVAVTGSVIKYFNGAARALFPEITEEADCRELFEGAKDVKGVQRLPGLGRVSVSHMGEYTVYTVFPEENRDDRPIAEFTRDLRGILSGIKYSADLLLPDRDETDPKRRRCMSIFYHNYYTLLYLVENIEALYDGSYINSKPRLSDTSLEELCRDITDAVSVLVGGRISVTFDCPDGNVRCAVDPEKFERMLLNIISNSLKSLGEKSGYIRISLRREDGDAVITVSDNGGGIQDSKMRALFDMRVKHRELTEAGAGLGLGLPIAAKLAEQHGGGITAENGEEGAVIRVRIPIRKGLIQFRSSGDFETVGMRRILTSLATALPAECYLQKYLD